jgi:hypothetical protein
MHRRFFSLLIAGLLYLAAASVPLAAGICPSGATYGPQQNQTLSGVYGITTCYYIAANGSDSNDGASEASGHPWLHAPGMPNCTSNCLTEFNTCVNNVCPGVGFVFRGGDTWHFGNSGASPYTGGTWNMAWAGYANCNYGASNTGCNYYGVDTSWYSGGSWARPVMTGDNSTSASLVSSCTYYPIAGTNGGRDNMIYAAPGAIIDNFELTGLCSNDTAPSGITDAYIAYGGTGLGGTGTLFIENVYIHGWSATAATVSSGTALPVVLIGGGNNGLQAMDHLVIDGSDAVPGVAAWGTFPSFYHFADSIVRYTTQGVGQWCHDIHDNIFEYIYNLSSSSFGHGNNLECNADSNGTAAYQPSGTPNVFYNNILRHFTTAFSTGGQVTLWFTPNSSVDEYWFNNLIYDVGNSNYWDVCQAPAPSCPSTTMKHVYMFNNTLVDGTQPCASGAGYNFANLFVYNEHLINTPFGGNGGTGCTGSGSASNVSMTDAIAIAQGYGTNTGAINTQTPGSINCANDSTTPCIPAAATSSTVGTGASQQAYCTQLASYTAEPAISTNAANGCQYGTTDGCAYNTSTHSMVCPAHIATARGTAWNVGAYQFSTSVSGSGPSAPTGLTATVH